MPLLINQFVENFSEIFQEQETAAPWVITENLPAIIYHKITTLGNDYFINQGIAVHRTATVEPSVILKAPVIISENCFIGANAYLRGGVYLGKNTVIGTSCEVKTCIIMDKSAVAHFNFIGDSVIGNQVNFEAGSIVANHYNERQNKQISVLVNSMVVQTNVQKFGALVGDFCKIGANAVLSPGTILNKNTLVKRLELIDQVPLP